MFAHQYVIYALHQQAYQGLLLFNSVLVWVIMLECLLCIITILFYF
jgi:hypothetical protein